MTWRVWPLIVSALLVSAMKLSAQPAVTDLQPRGIQKGKPFMLTLAGRNLGEGAKIRSTMPASFTPGNFRSARVDAERLDGR